MSDTSDYLVRENMGIFMGHISHDTTRFALATLLGMTLVSPGYLYGIRVSRIRVFVYLSQIVFIKPCRFPWSWCPVDVRAIESTIEGCNWLDIYGIFGCSVLQDRFGGCRLRIVIDEDLRLWGQH